MWNSIVSAPGHCLFIYRELCEVSAHMRLVSENRLVNQDVPHSPPIWSPTYKIVNSSLLNLLLEARKSNALTDVRT